jgi:hypothetical protein
MKKLRTQHLIIFMLQQFDWTVKELWPFLPIFH